ncbi:MAG: DegQ family serine endoprotease [Deltaproteobacteria bacterium]|nr:DegQ family serine endoprotease [Deltaproteobacteria bacterium]
MSPKRLLGVLFICMFMAVALFTTCVFAQDQALERLRETGKAFAAVARQASPAVVFIQVEKTVTSRPEWGGPMPFGDEFFRRFFGIPSPGRQQPQQQPQEQQRIVGQGSGFIISADGYILTNNHVVGDADKVTVKLLDGREFRAKTIGADPHTDVAVIKIDAKNLPALPLGNSNALEVGEWVLAIGNPFGLSHTLTAGIVSAKGRTSLGITDFEDFIQTDAAINPGNSGGPLINLAGRAVGINTAIFSQSGGYMGIGFAIPINMAKNIRDQLIAHGSVTRGYLGIVIQDLTPALAKTFDVKDAKGVLISEVSQGSPAEQAGLKQGDVIIEFNGKPVEKVGPFRNQVALIAPGTTANMTVIRNGKSQSLPVKIGKLPGGDLAARGPADVLEKLGFAVETLTGELAQRLGYQGETGVVVTQVASGSVAASAGIRPGALVKEVNRKQIHNVEEFVQALAPTGGKGTILLLIREGRGSRYVALSFKK